MENLQATTPTLPQPVSTAAAAAPGDPAAADPTTGEALTGFQTLLARQLKDLLAATGDAGATALDAAAAAAADEKAGDVAADAAAQAATPAEMPWLAMLQLMPAAPALAPGAQAAATAAGAGSDTALGALNSGPAGGGLRADPASARQAAQPLEMPLDAGIRAETFTLGDRMAGREPGADSRDAGMAGSQVGFLHNQPAGSAPTATTPAAVQTQLTTPLDHPAWGNELGQKLVWMVADKHHVAEMHINPPQLGPVDIKLTVDGNETTAVFTSPHSEVRQVLESSLPKLREVLAESGIMLGNASVTADSPRDGSAFAQPQQRLPRVGGDAGAGSEHDPIRQAPVPVRARGLVDLFA